MSICSPCHKAPSAADLSESTSHSRQCSLDSTLSPDETSPTDASSLVFSKVFVTTQPNNLNCEDEYQPPKHMTQGKLRRMLASLSFEANNILIFPRKYQLRRRRHVKGGDGDLSAPVNEICSSSDNESSQQSCSDNSGSINDSSASLNTNQYFDAVQSERDLLISSVVVHRAGYETVLNLLNQPHQILVDSDRNEYVTGSFDEYDNITGILTSRDRNQKIWIDSLGTDASHSVKNDLLDESFAYHNQGESTTKVAAFGPPIKFPFPSAPIEVPQRFLRAGKNDPIEGERRYQETLKWRKDENIDTILHEAHPNFHLIKRHYPHFCHLTGKKGEPCFYEQPAKTNLKALREGGVNLDSLLRHYIMVTEYQWQYLTRDDFMTSIYVIDLDGMKFSDFVGEVVDFVKRASKLSSQHYPERAGCVFVINVPIWFKVIWNVVKPIIDESTLQKIYILRGKDEVKQRMQERIDIENIPPEYGGTSMPLGESPEEKELDKFITHNNTLESSTRLRQCPCYPNNWRQCKFCTWQPARSY